MSPEVFEPLAGQLIAVALLVGDVALLVLILVGMGKRGSASRAPLMALALSLSIATLFVLLALYLPFWFGQGPVWALVASNPGWGGSVYAVIENILLWSPVLLLTLSLVLAFVSRLTREYRIAWLVVSVPALALVLFAVLVLGRTISPS